MSVSSLRLTINRWGCFVGVLSGPLIHEIVERTRLNGYANPEQLDRMVSIGIEPFVPANCGPNSVDVRLGNSLLVYRPRPTRGWWEWIRLQFGWRPPVELDANRDNPTQTITIPVGGMMIYPGRLYLGSTIETTVCSGCVPWLDGRSSVGRLGIQIHMTAGRGDDGFGELVVGGNSWTLEISCVHPVRIYPGMRIGQLTFFPLIGERRPYRGRYSHQHGPPVASKFHEPKPHTTE